jgi:hypothetical protein
MSIELQQKIGSVRLWRLNNLYRITDKNGRRVTFTMNSAARMTMSLQGGKPRDEAAMPRAGRPIPIGRSRGRHAP